MSRHLAYQGLSLAEFRRIAARNVEALSALSVWVAQSNGLLRRTTLNDYPNAEPKWETVLDIDALAKAENANWVYKGAACLEPEETRCLI